MIIKFKEQKIIRVWISLESRNFVSEIWGSMILLRKGWWRALGRSRINWRRRRLCLGHGFFRCHSGVLAVDSTYVEASASQAFNTEEKKWTRYNAQPCIAFRQQRYVPQYQYVSTVVQALLNEYLLGWYLSMRSLTCLLKSQSHSKCLCSVLFQMTVEGTHIGMNRCHEINNCTGCRCIEGGLYRLVHKKKTKWNVL